MSDTIKHLKQMLHKNPFDDETRLILADAYETAGHTQTADELRVGYKVTFEGGPKDSEEGLVGIELFKSGRIVVEEDPGPLVSMQEHGILVTMPKFGAYLASDRPFVFTWCRSYRVT